MNEFEVYHELALSWVGANNTLKRQYEALLLAQNHRDEAYAAVAEIEKQLGKSVVADNDMPPVRVFCISQDEAVMVQRAGGSFGNYTEIKLVTIEGT